ncbi:YceD family protein [Leuconostoc miyukkimchii]|uniref:YceD family protein n=1 Tax=Leuconostoc miyukkimchii TaxID=910540 RepID=UPI001C7DA765|nr:YceD family protein [Leuconostoc miyukkimchii]
MKYNKNQLQKYRQNALTFDEELNIENIAKERFPRTVLALSPLQVKGSIRYEDNDDLNLQMTVEGQITVPSSRSLTPVIHHVDLIIDERYIEDAQRLENFEETEPVFVLENETLDIDKAILDSIIAELPLQILTPEERDNETLPSGNDWHVISEETFENEKKSESKADLDPRLAKLDDFFKE